MKRGTPDNPKTLALCERLGVDQAKACGTLELLWLFTARYAPSGDVGRWSNAAIARACSWAGDPDLLVKVLLELGWLDGCSHARVIVHDWPEHADDFVHSSLCRALKTFDSCYGHHRVEPSDKRLPIKERKALAKKRSASARQALGERFESALPSRAVPCPSVPSATETPPLSPPAAAGGATARTPALAARIADQLGAVYRELLRKRPPKELVRHWRQELRQGVAEDALRALIEASAAEARAAEDADAEHRAGWAEATACVERFGGARVMAVAGLDWVERNRGPDESVDAALRRWVAESSWPPLLLAVLTHEIYHLRTREGRGEKRRGAGGRGPGEGEERVA